MGVQRVIFKIYGNYSQMFCFQLSSDDPALCLDGKPFGIPALGLSLKTESSAVTSGSSFNFFNWMEFKNMTLFPKSASVHFISCSFSFISCWESISCAVHFIYTPKKLRTRVELESQATRCPRQWGPESKQLYDRKTSLQVMFTNKTPCWFKKTTKKKS